MAEPEKRGGEGSARDNRVLAELEALRGYLRRLEAKVDALGKPGRPSEARVKTYIDGLDGALGGGIPRGHVVLVGGPSGTMKTSLALHMVHRNVEAGHPGVFVSLEESRDSLLATMRALGMEPRDDFIVDIGRLRMEQKAAEEARDWFQILREFLLRRQERQATELVVIDPLNALYALANLENPRDDLFHFFNFLRGLGMTSLLVSDSGESDRPFPNHEDFLADGAIQLKYTNAPDGKVAVGVRVVKMRHAEHSRDWLRLEFGGGRFSATPPAPATGSP